MSPSPQQHQQRTRLTILLACSAITYRLILWPSVLSSLSDASASCHPLVSLATKFIYVLISLACAATVVSFLSTPASAEMMELVGLGKTRSEVAVVAVCALVSTLDGYQSTAWVLQWLEAYLTGGRRMADSSLVDKTALLIAWMFVCSGVLVTALIVWGYISREAMLAWKQERRDLIVEEKEHILVPSKGDENMTSSQSHRTLLKDW